MYTYENINYQGYTINIHYDDSAENPRHAFDHAFTLYTRDHNGDASIDDLCDDNGEVDRRRLDREYIWLEVWKYEHSGVCFRTSVEGNPFYCPWDSGRYGIIAIRKEDARREWGWRRLTTDRLKKLYDWMDGEIQEFSDWADGSVFGYTIEDPDGEEIDDSCWGFYGSDHESSGLMEYAKAAIDGEINARTPETHAA